MFAIISLTAPHRPLYGKGGGLVARLAALELIAL
jgi:hypothetical protein